MCWTQGYTPEQWAAAGTWVQAVAAALTFAVAVVAAWYARRQVGEARTLREAQSEPFVTAALVSKDHVASLRIENHGSTPAFDVHFKFTPEFRSALDLGIADPTQTQVWSSGFPTLVPGQSMDILLDTFIARHPRKDLPQAFDVDVSYHDFRKMSCSYRYTIDFGVFYSLGHIVEKDMDDLVREVESLRKLLHGIADRSTGSIRVMTVDDERKSASLPSRARGRGTEATNRPLRPRRKA